MGRADWLRGEYPGSLQVQGFLATLVLQDLEEDSTSPLVLCSLAEIILAIIVG